MLLSDSTFTQLNSAYSSTLQSTVALLHMGEWRSVADGWPQNAAALYQVITPTPPNFTQRSDDRLKLGRAVKHDFKPCTRFWMRCWGVACVDAG